MLFCVFSPNSTDFEADYITVVEDRRIRSIKYCLPCRIYFWRQLWRTLQRGLSAIAEHLVIYYLDLSTYKKLPQFLYFIAMLYFSRSVYKLPWPKFWNFKNNSQFLEKHHGKTEIWSYTEVKNVYHSIFIYVLYMFILCFIMFIIYLFIWFCQECNGESTSLSLQFFVKAFRDTDFGEIARKHGKWPTKNRWTERAPLTGK